MVASRFETLAQETGIPVAFWKALKDDPRRERRMTTTAALLTDENGRTIPRPPAGTPITISAAARKYNVSQPNVTRWAQRGHIRRLSKEAAMPGFPIEVDEQSVYDAVAMYRQAPGQGRNPLKSPKGIARRLLGTT